MNAFFEVSAKEQRLSILKPRGTSQNLSLSASRIGNEMSLMSKILVVGSANADLMIAMPKLPKPGETVRGYDFLVAPGGKGANQATAAARLGGDVGFIGSIGDDDFGKSLRASLFDSGVDTAYLSVIPKSSTGVGNGRYRGGFDHRLPVRVSCCDDRARYHRCEDMRCAGPA